MKKKVLLSVLLLASCLSLGSCRIVGIKGDTGPTGPSDAQGEKGEDGRTPTISISEDGYWVIDGVKSTTLAQGVKGDTGDKGDSGEPGTKWIYDQGNPIDLPLEYAQMVLGGEMEHYLSLGCNHGRMED